MDSIEAPTVPILLLGDASVGKSTFLSRVTLGGRPLQPGEKLPVLRDLDQPFKFDVRFHPREARLEFYDTQSPDNYSLLKPAVIVLCFAINDPGSLDSIQTTWKGIVETHFNYNETIPVILLGLKRDVRSYDDYHGQYRPLANGINGSTRTFVYPEEAIKIAQEMRLDKYCECSAVTGELCREVFEDICKTAAMTLTTGGGRSEGTACSVM